MTTKGAGDILAELLYHDLKYLHIVTSFQIVSEVVSVKNVVKMLENNSKNLLT